MNTTAQDEGVWGVIEPLGILIVMAVTQIYTLLNLIELPMHVHAHTCTTKSIILNVNLISKNDIKK